LKKNITINSDIFNGLYYLFIKTLVGKLIKKGKKNKALKFYKILRENIKLNTKKKSFFYIFIINV